MTDHTRHPRRPAAPPAERLPAPEDFWLELGPPSAYYGTDAYDTARRTGDASPDAERLGWQGAEPPRPAGPDASDNAPPARR